MAQRKRIQRRRLAEHLSAVRPDIVDPAAEIAAGRVLVDGRIVRRVALADDADLVALVKPMFELQLAGAPTDAASVDAALARAAQGIADAGWEVTACAESPVRGARGAVEGFVRARRRAP